MYIVIHSQDPYLLARMATDLQMEDVECDTWNYSHHPFMIGYEWVCIRNFVFWIFSHECKWGKEDEIHIELTEYNYIETLSLILNSK